MQLEPGKTSENSIEGFKFKQQNASYKLYFNNIIKHSQIIQLLH